MQGNSSLALALPCLIYLRRVSSVVFLLLTLSGTVRLDAATIEFWHPWPYAAKTVRELAANYRRERGVVVKVRSFRPSTYDPWAVRSPDVIGLSRPNKKSVSALVARGRVHNLQPQMSRGWYSRLWPGLAQTFVVRRGNHAQMYGAPLTGQVYLFVYNKNLFKKAGVGPIHTWQDLMTASQRLRAKAIVPYAGGFGSNMPPLAHAYEWSYLGLHNLAQTYFGNYPYTSQDWVRQLNLYSEMRRSGFTSATWASVSEVTAMKLLLDARVAMVFAGPSFEMVRRAYKPGFHDWGVFAVPVDPRGRFLPRLPGGVVEGVVVNARSNAKTEAIRFAMWLTEPRQQVKLANATHAIPATTSATNSRNLRPDIQLFVRGMRDQSVDLRVYENSRTLNAFYGGTRDLLRGYWSPRQVAEYVQQVKRR